MTEHYPFLQAIIVVGTAYFLFLFAFVASRDYAVSTILATAYAVIHIVIIAVSEKDIETDIEDLKKKKRREKAIKSMARFLSVLSLIALVMTSIFFALEPTALQLIFLLLGVLASVIFVALDIYLMFVKKTEVEFLLKDQILKKDDHRDEFN